MLTTSSLLVVATAAVQLLLWRDQRKAIRAKSDESLQAYRDSNSLPLQAIDVDEKKAIRSEMVTVVSVDQLCAKSDIFKEL